MDPNSLGKYQLCFNSKLSRKESLLSSVTFPIRIDAVDSKVFTMFADWSFAATFCLPMPTRFASVANTMFVPDSRRSCGRGTLAATAQSRYGYLWNALLQGP